MPQVYMLVGKNVNRKMLARHYQVRLMDFQTLDASGMFFLDASASSPYNQRASFKTNQTGQLCPSDVCKRRK